MTNREKYREQIIDICAMSERPILNADRLTGCSSRDCKGCPNCGIDRRTFSGQDFPAKHKKISRSGWKKNASQKLTGREYR